MTDRTDCAATARRPDYFDALAGEVSRASGELVDDAGFLAAVALIDARLTADAFAVAGDREFPDDLRHRVLAVLATKSLHQPTGLPVPERARHEARLLRFSPAVEAMRAPFRDLARRGVVTRFGPLTGDPAEILRRRDAHDELRHEEEA